MLDPAVRASWIAWNAPFEGRVSHLYLDTRGLVTTGVGNLVDPISLALPLPWQTPGGAPASLRQAQADWWRVKSLPKGLPAGHYSSPEALVLTDEAIDELVLHRLDVDAVALERTFPDFPDWPAPAQQAVLSLAWACGTGWPVEFPHCAAAVAAQDWTSASQRCGIHGNAARNAADIALFEQAAIDACAPTQRTAA